MKGENVEIQRSAGGGREGSWSRIDASREAEPHPRAVGIVEGPSCTQSASLHSLERQSNGWSWEKLSHSPRGSFGGFAVQMPHSLPQVSLWHPAPQGTARQEQWDKDKDKDSLPCQGPLALPSPQGCPDRAPSAQPGSSLCQPCPQPGSARCHGCGPSQSCALSQAGGTTRGAQAGAQHGGHRLWQLGQLLEPSLPFSQALVGSSNSHCSSLICLSLGQLLGPLVL